MSKTHVITYFKSRTDKGSVVVSNKKLTRRVESLQAAGYTVNHTPLSSVERNKLAQQRAQRAMAMAT